MMMMSKCVHVCVFVCVSEVDRGREREIEMVGLYASGCIRDDLWCDWRLKARLETPA